MDSEGAGEQKVLSSTPCPGGDQILAPSVSLSWNFLEAEQKRLLRGGNKHKVCKSLTPNVLYSHWTADRFGPGGTGGDPSMEGSGRLSLNSGDAKYSEDLNAYSLMRNSIESSFWEMLSQQKFRKSYDVHAR